MRRVAGVGAALAVAVGLAAFAGGDWQLGLLWIAGAALLKLALRRTEPTTGWSEDERGSWAVELRSTGPRVIDVIAVLRAEGRLDFRTAKAATRSDGTVTPLRGVSRVVAERLAGALRAKGADALAVPPT